jgi:hypothetical protein
MDGAVDIRLTKFNLQRIFTIEEPVHTKRMGYPQQAYVYDPRCA